MAPFHYEFRVRSWVGVVVCALAILAVLGFALFDLDRVAKIISVSFFGVIAIGMSAGLFTNHSVGSSVDSEVFKWWSAGGFLSFRRAIPLETIESVEYVHGRNRQYLHVVLLNGRKFRVGTSFFLDGEKLLEALRSVRPEIVTMRNGRVV